VSAKDTGSGMPTQMRIIRRVASVLLSASALAPAQEARPQLVLDAARASVRVLPTVLLDGTESDG
jgi:hypothetical protein